VLIGDGKTGYINKAVQILHARIHIYVYLRYGERWRELRAVAHDKGCTSETRASRATPTYI
jgi:hypothetical protein